MKVAFALCEAPLRKSVVGGLYLHSLQHVVDYCTWLFADVWVLCLQSQTSFPSVMQFSPFHAVTCANCSLSHKFLLPKMA